MVSNTVVISMLFAILAAGVAIVGVITTLLSNRIGDLALRVDSMNTTMETRFGAVEMRLGAIEERLTTLEVKLGER